MRVAAALNIGLGLVGLAWLLLRTTRRRSEYPTEVLQLLYLCIALFFGLLSTSVVIYFDHTGPAFNVAVIAIVKVFALFVLWQTRTTKYRTGTRQDDGNPQADENLDIP